MFTKKMLFLLHSSRAGEESFFRHLTYQVSAVLQGVKPAELVTLKNRVCDCIGIWTRCKVEILAALRLDCVQLRTREDSISLLFYSPTLLQGRIEALRGHRLLRMHAYPVKAGLPMILNRLAQRFSEETVPHEVGLFLGYPERDVEAFVQGRQDHCFCRYWKVYHDPVEAHKMMERIDQARCLAAEMLSKYEAWHAAVEALQENIA